jgi:hypothetical protein
MKLGLITVVAAVLAASTPIPTLAQHAFSQQECENAMRSYRIATNRIKPSKSAIAAAEAEMRAKCYRPERPVYVVPGGSRNLPDCAGPYDTDCVKRW